MLLYDHFRACVHLPWGWKYIKQLQSIKHPKSSVNSLPTRMEPCSGVLWWQSHEHIYYTVDVCDEFVIFESSSKGTRHKPDCPQVHTDGEGCLKKKRRMVVLLHGGYGSNDSRCRVSGVEGEQAQQQQARKAYVPGISAVKQKEDLPPFSGDKKDGWTWSKVLRIRTRSSESDAGFDVPGNEDIKRGIVGLDSLGDDPRTFQDAEGTWRSLVTACKGGAFDIVERAESPSETWHELAAYYQVESVIEQ